MSFTATPDSRSSLAVPPVEISSTPNPESLRAKSANPVLSVTLRMARWILDIAEILSAAGDGRSDGCKRSVSSLGVELDFGPRFQLNLSVLHLNRIFDGLTAVFLADLRSFLLYERRETV